MGILVCGSRSLNPSKLGDIFIVILTEALVMTTCEFESRDVRSILR